MTTSSKKASTKAASPFIFSEKRIKQLTQLFKDKVAEIMRLQSAGKLPYYKKIPKSVVHTADIMVIMDRSERTAQRIMAKVRKKLNKTLDEYISVKDFSRATGIDEWTIQRALDMCT